VPRATPHAFLPYAFQLEFFSIPMSSSLTTRASAQSPLPDVAVATMIAASTRGTTMALTADASTRMLTAKLHPPVRATGEVLVQRSRLTNQG
jgi:hypothetical protein